MRGSLRSEPSRWRAGLWSRAPAGALGWLAIILLLCRVGQVIESVSDASLSPLRFLERSAEVWSDRPAVSDGARSWSYAAHADRVARLAGALRAEFGIRPGDRVAALLPNIAAMLEVHYAVPGTGAILVPLNTRLTAGDYSYILEHSGATAIIAATALATPLQEALSSIGAASRPQVLWVDSQGAESCDYETLIAGAQGRRARLPG